MATTNLIESELHEHERQLLLRTGYSIVLKHKEFGPASAQEFFATVKRMRRHASISGEGGSGSNGYWLHRNRWLWSATVKGCT
jgi:hypothetical protein